MIYSYIMRIIRSLVLVQQLMLTVLNLLCMYVYIAI